MTEDRKTNWRVNSALESVNDGGTEELGVKGYSTDLSRKKWGVDHALADLCFSSPEDSAYNSNLPEVNL